MNTRLLSYLRSLGLAADASESDAWEFFQDLRGLQRQIANCLNYIESDAQARTTCDLALRAMGVEPNEPHAMLRDADVDNIELVDDGSNYDAVRDDAVAAERGRISRIEELAEMAHAPAAMVRSAIDDGQSIEDAQAAFLQHYRSTHRATVDTDLGNGGRAAAQDEQRNALLAAMLVRENMGDPTRYWPTVDRENGNIILRDRGSDPTIERAAEMGYQLRSLSMVEIARRCLQVDGIECEPTAPSIGLALQRAAQSRTAATGTGTLTGVFSDSFTALLIQAYMEAPDTTDGWTNTRDVPNYHVNERTRMEVGGNLSQRGRGGTAEMDDIADAVELYKVREYAKQFVVDEQDLINDSFGALENWSPQRLGRAAARLRPDLVYSILLANDNMRDGTALFDATHGNVLTTSALAVETLEAGRALMRIQQENNVNLNLMARYLIVPAQLESTAETLVVSPLVVMAGSGDRVRGNVNSNARAGMLPVADARLDNGVTDPATGTTHAGSATTWFLATEASGHTIEVGYVRQLGRVPRVRTKVLDEGRFGISFDVQHSVGAKAIDWRGLVKATA